MGRATHTTDVTSYFRLRRPKRTRRAAPRFRARTIAREGPALAALALLSLTACTSRIVRTIPELADFLGRSLEFPDGVCLLTGAGIVPGSDFTLQPGDDVTIEIEGIGTLVNRVKVV